jgi:hypothetical protein
MQSLVYVLGGILFCMAIARTACCCGPKASHLTTDAQAMCFVITLCKTEMTLKTRLLLYDPVVTAGNSWAHRFAAGAIGKALFVWLSVCRNSSVAGCSNHKTLLKEWSVTVVTLITNQEELGAGSWSNTSAIFSSVTRS